MMSIPRSLVLVITAAALGSCSSLKKKQEPVAEAPAEAKAQRVGSVALIHPDYGFVLIQTAKGVSFPEGTELRCYSVNGQESAKLKCTAARQGNYITADVASGSPQKDDVVFYDPSGALVAAATAVPQAPAPVPVPMAPALEGYPDLPATAGSPIPTLPNLTTPSVSASPVTAPGPALPEQPLAPGSLLPKSAPALPDADLRPAPTVKIGQ